MPTCDNCISKPRVLTVDLSGRAYKNRYTSKDVDVAELKTGVKIEMEHTNDAAIAKKIALDHLAEIPDYYTRLVKMEKDAGVDV